MGPHSAGGFGGGVGDPDQVHGNHLVRGHPGVVRTPGAVETRRGRGCSCPLTRGGLGVYAGVVSRGVAFSGATEDKAGRIFLAVPTPGVSPFEPYGRPGAGGRPARPYGAGVDRPLRFGGWAGNVGWIRDTGDSSLPGAPCSLGRTAGLFSPSRTSFTFCWRRLYGMSSCAAPCN